MAKNKFFLLLCLALIMTLGSSTQRVIKQINGTIPSYIYPLKLSAEDSIVANLTWTGSQEDFDLDLYFYASGSNLLDYSDYLTQNTSTI